MSTRVSQRWRKPSNQINNTVDSVSDKIDFLISAPYADKLPPKVAELIRKEIPFAVLLPFRYETKLKELVKPASTNPFVKKKTAIYETDHSDLFRSRMAN